MRPKYCKDCKHAKIGHVMKDNAYNPANKPEKHTVKLTAIHQCHVYAFTITDSQRPLMSCTMGVRVIKDVEKFY